MYSLTRENTINRIRGAWSQHDHYRMAQIALEYSRKASSYTAPDEAVLLAAWALLASSSAPQDVAETLLNATMEAPERCHFCEGTILVSAECEFDPEHEDARVHQSCLIDDRDYKADEVRFRHENRQETEAREKARPRRETPR